MLQNHLEHLIGSDSETVSKANFIWIRLKMFSMINRHRRVDFPPEHKNWNFLFCTELQL